MSFLPENLPRKAEMTQTNRIAGEIARKAPASSGAFKKPARRGAPKYIIRESAAPITVSENSATRKVFSARSGRPRLRLPPMSPEMAAGSEVVEMVKRKM